MLSYNDKAEKLVSDAEKKLYPPKGIINFFMTTIFGKTSRIEEAIECYQKAAYLYKMSQNWHKAGNAFHECANLNVKLNSTIDAASKYLEAGNCFKKCDYTESINCFEKAINIYIDMGKFTIAAKLHENIAEIYSFETPDDIDTILKHYEKASNYFQGEENNSSANKCLLKIARLEAKRLNYEKAISIFETIAISALNNSLLKYSVKEYFFSAVLCNLCVDLINAQDAIERYVNLYPAFEDTQEYKLLKLLVKNIEEDNIDGLVKSIKNYDSICHLDSWQNSILLRIKKQLTGDIDLR